MHGQGRSDRNSHHCVRPADLGLARDRKPLGAESLFQCVVVSWIEAGVEEIANRDEDGAIAVAQVVQGTRQSRLFCCETTGKET